MVSLRSHVLAEAFNGILAIKFTRAMITTSIWESNEGKPAFKIQNHPNTPLTKLSLHSMPKFTKEGQRQTVFWGPQNLKVLKPVIWAHRNTWGFDLKAACRQILCFRETKPTPGVPEGCQEQPQQCQPSFPLTAPTCQDPLVPQGEDLQSTLMPSSTQPSLNTFSRTGMHY